MPSNPCIHFKRGTCRYGDGCKFSHVQEPTANNPSGSGARAATAHPPVQAPTSVAGPSRAGAARNASFAKRPKPKRGEIPCKAWKTGACAKGDKCWFGHDPQVLEELRRQEQEAAQRRAAAEELNRQRLLQHQREAQRELERRECAERLRLAEERRQAQIEAQRRMAREREEAERLAREEEQMLRDVEAAKSVTLQRVVQGSIVTFGAGLEILSTITGFESCVVRIKNLPPDAQEHEISALFLQQGIARERFQIIKLRRYKPHDKLEAEVAIDVEHGAAIVAGLDEIEFRDERLTLELGPYNATGAMGSCSGKDPNTLTVSWFPPSARYTASYPDQASALAKVTAINQSVFQGRRLQARPDQDPSSAWRASNFLHKILILNLPCAVTTEDIARLAGTDNIRRLKGPNPFSAYDADSVVEGLRRRIDTIVPMASLSFQEKRPTQPEGVFSVDVKFDSPEQAQRAQMALANVELPCIGKSYRTHLPDPMLYLLRIPKEQYRPQRDQWTELLRSVRGTEGCRMFLREEGNVVRIRVAGSIKKVVGAVKLRVERLASGEMVAGWHRSMGFSKFVQDFFDETGVHLRADWKTQTLKLYGDAAAIEGARRHIARELERLAEAEVTRYLKRESLRFFRSAGRC
ncbi:hypothetical protein HGRIS_002676 [Hohenbuehelia grisea]|uniref:C3H1-type domain-containing protein n=1 Tax=Hohenbuehelia grisea TaxID=104357 RepID=A0ABR3JM47_9AGAR